MFKILKIEKANLEALKNELREIGHYSLSTEIEEGGTLEIGSLAKILKLRTKLTNHGSLMAVEELEERKEFFLASA